MSSLSNLKFANFAKTLVTTTGFNGSTTSFAVTTGTGSRFPAVPFRATFWCLTDYPDPADARWNSAGEVWEVTARSTDSLTVLRAREGTSAISYSAGKTYAMELVHTAAHINSTIAGVFNPLSPEYGGTGDGVANDTSAILAATAACKAAGGGIIWFPDGTYLLDKVNWLIDFSNCWILGSAKAKIKLNETPTGGHSNAMLSVIGAPGSELENIRIEGLEFDGSATGTTGVFVTPGAIDIYDVKRFWIEHCYIHDCMCDGIDVDYDGGETSEFWISKNVIRTVYRNSISVVGGNEIFHITDNICDGYATFGIDLEPNNPGEIIRFCDVSGNYTKPNATRLNTANSDRAAGIFFTAPNRQGTITDATNASPIVITISEDYLDYQTGELVVISGVLGNTAANGFFRLTNISSTQFSLDGTTGNGAYTSGGTTNAIARQDESLGRCTIARNIIDGLYAADAFGGATYVPRKGIGVIRVQAVSIVGNVLYKCGGGINVASEGATHQYGSIGEISGNHLRYCWSVGIAMYSNFAINNNVVEFTGGVGIQIAQSHNTIIGNIVRNSGQEPSFGFSYGIWIESDFNLAIGNHCFDDQESSPGVADKTQEYGIYMDNGVVDNIVTDNTVIGNNTAGIRLPSVISTNKIHGNLGFATEATGTDTIASGSTAKTVTHGLAWTPRAQEIVINLLENPSNDPGNIWVSNIGATTFDVNCRANPGASNLDFAWAVIARP